LKLESYLKFFEVLNIARC